MKTLADRGGRRENFRMGSAASRIYDLLDAISARSEFLHSANLDPESELPLKRYLFEGPSGGGYPISIGLFAGIHGDEPAGTTACVRLLEELVRRPEIAEGYHLYFYPICNPAGFNAGTRCAPCGKDLNREFWKDSAEIEVRVLEQEILQHAFQGLVSFHTDDTSEGLYGFVRGAVLARSLLKPALAAAERHLPRNRNPLIDGFPAEDGIISECYDGILTAPPKLQGTPFEIILETPHHAPEADQVAAFVEATRTILTEYRKFIAFAADL